MATLTLAPLPAPIPQTRSSPNTKAAGSALDPAFGRLVTSDVDFDSLSENKELVQAIQDALYKHSVLVFPNAKVSPEAQYALTKSFDPASGTYGHGNGGPQKNSILHPDLKTVPRQPQVQVIGNGFVPSHEGLENIQLKHPHHRTFHQTKVPDEEDTEVTRFYRWHIDSALYDLATPRVTTLYGLRVPQGRRQTLRYDDGSGDELTVPLGTTAFVSGKTLFNRLSPAEKSVAVRTKIVYAPHPYVWMSGARSNSTGLGLVSEKKELPLDQLPPVEESKIKVLPMVWKNLGTGELHLQVHPSAIKEVIVEPLERSSAAGQTDELYPSGAHLTDLQQVRDFVYSFQRPGIAPEYVYCHDWSPTADEERGDMVLFHNSGVLHSVVGAFTPDEIRIFHQCNLAASADPVGPSAEDIAQYV